MRLFTPLLRYSFGQATPSRAIEPDAGKFAGVISQAPILRQIGRIKGGGQIIPPPVGKPEPNTRIFREHGR